MNKVLKTIEEFTLKLRQASIGWETKSGRVFQQRMLDEMDEDLKSYSVDDLMTYVSLKITRTEESSAESDYPTINFQQ